MVTGGIGPLVPFRPITAPPPPQPEQSGRDGRKNAPPQVEAEAEAPSARGTSTAGLSGLGQDSKGVERDEALRNQILRPTSSGKSYDSALSQFVQLRNEGQLSEAFNLNPAEVGIQEYYIGLVGSLRVNLGYIDKALLQAVVTRLLNFVVTEEDLFLFNPALKAILLNADQLQPETVKQLISIVNNSDLLQNANVDIRLTASEFVNSLPLRGTPAIRSNPLLSVSPQVLAKLTPESRERITALLMQAKTLTLVSDDRVIRDQWMTIYTLLLQVSAQLSLLEQEIDPYIPDLVGLVIDKKSFLSPKWDGFKAIQVVSGGDLVSGYVDAYRYLLQRYFKHIYALVPHSGYFDLYAAAAEAATTLPYPPHVIDTKTFGPANGLLVDFIAQALYNIHQDHTVDVMMQHYINRFRYWVVPQLSVVSSQKWFKKMPKRRPIRGALYPVLAVYEDPFCLHALPSPSEAALVLQQQLETCLTAIKGYHKAVIEYHAYPQIAQELAEFTRQNYPQISVELRASDSLTSAYWGEHVSIGVI
jgi:hypothetical protein